MTTSVSSLTLLALSPLLSDNDKEDISVVFINRLFLDFDYQFSEIFEDFADYLIETSSITAEYYYELYNLIREFRWAKIVARRELLDEDECI